MFNWYEIAKRNGASHCAALHIAHLFDADSFALCNVTEHNGNICFRIANGGSKVFNVIFNQNGNVVSAKEEM